MDNVCEVEGDNIWDNIGTYRDVSGRVNFGVVVEGKAQPMWVDGILTIGVWIRPSR